MMEGDFGSGNTLFPFQLVKLLHAVLYMADRWEGKHGRMGSSVVAFSGSGADQADCEVDSGGRSLLGLEKIGGYLLDV